MKIKDGFILREVAGSYIVVAVGKRTKEFNGVINLNESSAFLWKNLLAPITEDELVEKLLGEYDVPVEVAKRDVSAFLGKLREAGLLE